jgi:dihydroceramide fatty acyl 2-hydroxylase
VLALGTPAAHVFAAGFLFGYLVYDVTHCHVHHQDDTRRFGVSAPFWDYVFGTPLKRGR